MGGDTDSVLGIRSVDDSRPSAQTPRRPVGVTVVSIFLMIFSILGVLLLISIVDALRGGLSGAPGIVALAVVLSLLISMLMFVMGIGILVGQNWARQLFLWLVPLDIGLGLLAGAGAGAGIVVKLILFIIFASILTSQSAKKYFGVDCGSHVDDDYADDLIEQDLTKCPACKGGISEQDEFCPSCDLRLKYVNKPEEIEEI